jgi:hypothetical protein
MQRLEDVQAEFSTADDILEEVPTAPKDQVHLNMLPMQPWPHA